MVSKVTKFQKITQQALILPPIERAVLVEHILESFNFQSRKEIDALWADEVEDRIDAYDAEKIK